MFKRRALLLAFGLLAGGAIALQDPCSGLRLLFKASPDAPTPGQTLKIGYTLSNKSGKNIQSSAVAITLPDDITYVSSGSKPRGAAGTRSGSDVVWANAGAIKAGKSKTYTVAATVGEDAQVLGFDAEADVVLSDGTTCTVEAPTSQVRAKGYNHAVAANAGNGVYGYNSKLDANGGLAQRVLLSAEGLEVVHLCFFGSDAPPELAASGAESNFAANPSRLYSMIAIRPSSLTSPGVAPLTSWYGYCEEANASNEMWNLDGPRNLENSWCLGGESNAITSIHKAHDYDDVAYLWNEMNGGIGVWRSENGNMLNWAASVDNTCNTMGKIIYVPSGDETLPYILD